VPRTGGLESFTYSNYVVEKGKWIFHRGPIAEIYSGNTYFLRILSIGIAGHGTRHG
jgi:hypothetical protein